MKNNKIQKRLEYLRGEIKAERISYGEIAELQSLAKHIPPHDMELLEWAGVPETPHTPDQDDKPIYKIIVTEEKHPAIGYNMGSLFTAEAHTAGVIKRESFFDKESAVEWLRKQHVAYLLNSLSEVFP